MSKLVLVRHGQASFFQDDYDRLSPVGERQSRALAEHWLRHGVAFDEVYAGTLKRQTRTAEVVGDAFREAGVSWPELVVLDGLNEYDADAIMGSLLPELRARDDRIGRLDDEFRAAADGQERYRTFHRLLEAVMAEYIRGAYTADGFEPWEAFSGRVRDALRRIMGKPGNGRRIAVFTSGGPIGVSVQTMLGAPDIKAAELNWRVHNCSLTEFTFSSERVALDAFNAVPHLLAEPELLTYR
jgi:broad specificity phosphatase PhoE